jgi:hypothetical protein
MVAVVLLLLLIEIFWDVTHIDWYFPTFGMTVIPSSSGSKRNMTRLLNPEDEHSKVFETLVTIRQSTQCNSLEDLNLQRSSPYLYCS